MNVITLELLSKIKQQYRLKWHGTHGAIHWSRVFEIGVRLSRQEDVNPRVVQLFSVFHDSRRKNEHWDKNHGQRGAELAIQFRDHCSLEDDEFDLLVTACTLHTSTINHENRTIQACFDSDRLDLGRVSKYPDADLLCTPMAKDPKMIEWAYQRSLVHELPKDPFGLSDFNT